MSQLQSPALGFGIGLRTEHYPDILAGARGSDWFEAITENYLDTAGRPLELLERIRADYALALHGVGLSIGSADDLDELYLGKLRALVDRLQPALVTDHLCWTGVDGRPLYDLLPLPYTEEALAHVVARVKRVQERLGRRIALENPSAYLGFAHSVLDEAELLAEVAAQADCGILLDVNNVYVSARNLGSDPYRYLDRLPRQRVVQIHLAGFTDMGSYLFDTHSAPVHEEVWELYRHAVRRFGSVATLVEWDADIPSFERVCAESGQARRIAAEVADDASAATAATERHVLVLRSASKGVDAPELACAQRMFAEIIAGEQPVSPSPWAERWLVPSSAEEQSRRVRAYADGYPARIMEAMTESFPATAHILGARRFGALVVRYVHACPPRSYNLNLCGDRFPSWVSADPIAGELPFIADLAELEWALVTAFHAPVMPSIDLGWLSELTTEQWLAARLSFQPSVSLLSSAWPVRTIWEARSTPLAEIDIDLGQGGEDLLVWRSRHRVECERLEPTERCALAGLLAGRPLAEVIDELAQAAAPGDAIGRWFARWSSAGLIQRVVAPPARPNASKDISAGFPRPVGA